MSMNPTQPIALTYVLNSRVMFTPGDEEVGIPIQCVTLTETGEHINDRQEYVAGSLSTFTSATSLVEEIRALALAALAQMKPAGAPVIALDGRQVGVVGSIEVITLAEWGPRWQAAQERRANDMAALRRQLAETQAQLAKASGL